MGHVCGGELGYLGVKYMTDIEAENIWHAKIYIEYIFY